MKPLPQLARRRVRVAAADLARVQQALAFPAADVERCNAPGLGPELLHESDDWEGVALRALRLDPAFLPAGAVRRVRAIRNYAFKPHSAGVLVDGPAIPLQMVDVDQRWRRAREQLLQAALTLNERQFPQVLAAQPE